MSSQTTVALYMVAYIPHDICQMLRYLFTDIVYICTLVIMYILPYEKLLSSHRIIHITDLQV